MPADRETGTSWTHRLPARCGYVTRCFDPGRQERGDGGICVRRGAGRRYLFTSVRSRFGSPAEVAGEEPSRAVALVFGHRVVPARVGVQSLLLRGESIEQRDPGCAVEFLVVPRNPVLDGTVIFPGASIRASYRKTRRSSRLGDYILWEAVTYGGWTAAECVRRFSFVPHCAHKNVASLRGTACTCWHLKHLIFVDFCGVFGVL